MAAANTEQITIGLSQAQLRRRNKNVSILIEMNNLFATCQTVKEVFDGALAKVFKHFQFKAGRVYLLDKDRQLFTLVSSRGIDPTGLEVVKISEGFTGRAAGTRSFIAQKVTDLGNEDRKKLLLSKGIKTIVCVPLLLGNEVIGVINLGTDRKIRLTREKIDVLVAIGSAVAVAVNRAELCENMEKSLEEIKHKKETIEFFTYTASHDLKSPTIALYGLTNLLKKQYIDVLDERGRRYCDQILKAAEQVVALIDGINGYVQSKESPLHLVRINMKQLIGSIREEFAAKLDQRSISWSEPEALPEITADELGIKRILRNLVENAVKYGGEKLSRIEIGYGEDESFHILSVMDDGVGLADEDMKKLFKPFQREKTSQGTEGTGLGLAIVKEVAARHGGKVWLKERASGGVTFYVAVAKDLGQ
ncbi:ATP-binding protein [Desulfoferrobacter suflitae]|uniref:ATP-binding protein n=1 Tax=Desulfoferrobacter suflitae TaxID=2865782 RepID=UPI0021642F41|nr:ATP-binding protein [Desulfoferrobacter suflitae]MCK8603754.1 ATP-binding protein [Desulfoferrobacter suflitae]